MPSWPAGSRGLGLILLGLLLAMPLGSVSARRAGSHAGQSPSNPSKGASEAHAPFLAKVTAKLSRADGQQEGDQFGRAVAVAGDVAVVGAYLDEEHGSDAGAAHIFVRHGDSWFAQQKLLGDPQQRFGRAVAVAGDFIAIGAPQAPDTDGTKRGAVYVFKRRGSTWEQQQKLTTPSGLQGDAFGSSLALNEFHLLVGAPADESRPGSAYVFVQEGESWTHDTTLRASDEADNNQFGHAVALAGNLSVVGAPLERRDGTQAGAAYVFERRSSQPQGATWTETKRLLASSGAVENQFGFSVAIHGETILVGAPLDTPSDPGGAAYAFARGPCDWTEAKKLVVPSDVREKARFGHAVALHAGTAIVAAPGGAVAPKSVVYSFMVEERRHRQRLTTTAPRSVGKIGDTVAFDGRTLLLGADSNDGFALAFARVGSDFAEPTRLTPWGGSALREFGRTVAVSGNTAVIGGSESRSVNQAVYVFVRDDRSSTWNQQAVLVPPEAAESTFGAAVSIKGDILVVGAPNDSEAAFRAGAAYVFMRDDGEWTLVRKLLASDATTRDNLGAAVAVRDDNVVLIGAPRAGPDGAEFGAAYVFRAADSSGWQNDVSEHKLTAADGSNLAWFGEAVAITEEFAVVGASGALGGGAAYVFTSQETSWVEEARIVASDQVRGQAFGRAVAASGSTILVGTIALADAWGHNLGGSAYMFVHAGSTTTQLQRLSPPDLEPGDLFGCSVAVADDIAVVGARGDDDGGAEAGAAYVFDRGQAAWTQRPAKLTAPDASPKAFLGIGVAADGSLAIAGAAYAAEYGLSNSGSAYAFDLANALLPRGAPCNTDTDCEGGFCVEGICCDTRCEGADAECVSCQEALKADGSPDGTCGVVSSGVACGPVPAMCRGRDEVLLAPVCNGEGRCEARAAPCADGFACVAGCCAGACTVDDVLDHERCAASHFCQPSGNCTLDRQGGMECEFNDQCASGLCDTGRCTASPDCEDDEDCSRGGVCRDAQCVPVGTGCDEDGGCPRSVPSCADAPCGAPRCSENEPWKLIHPDGSRTSCAPYLCDRTTQACPHTCADTSACDEGFTCVDHTCVPPTTAAEGCGCRLARGSDPHAGSYTLMALWLLGGGACYRRCRTRRRNERRHRR